MSKNNSSPSKLRSQKQWFERHRKMKDAVNTDLGWLGPILAEAVATHWREHDQGPLWREALQAPELVAWWKDVTGMAFIGRPFCSVVMQKTQRAGWVTFSKRERSLCPGRRYYAHDAEVSQAEPDEIGFQAAAFVGAFRDAYGHSPDWVQMSVASDGRGMPLFTDPDDAAAQFRWLNTSRWLYRQDDGSLRRTPRAKREADRRAATPALVSQGV